MAAGRLRLSFGRVRWAAGFLCRVWGGVAGGRALGGRFRRFQRRQGVWVATCPGEPAPRTPRSELKTPDPGPENGTMRGPRARVVVIAWRDSLLTNRR